MNAYLLALLLVAVDPGAPVDVDTRIVQNSATYAIGISPKAAVHLHFPFACLSVNLPKDAVIVANAPSHPTDVFLMTQPNIPVGSKFKGSALCEQGMRFAFDLTVVPLEEVSPQIEFQWEPGALSAFQERLDAGLGAARADCEKQIAQARVREASARGKFIVAQARQAFTVSSDHETARNGSVIVYVDTQKRLGDLGIIEFRVQNRERGPVYIDQVEVLGTGSTSPPILVWVEDHTLLENPTTPSDSDSVQAPLTEGYVLLPTVLLQSGMTVEGAVAFPWMPDTTRFELTLHVRAPDERTVVVRNIDF